MSDPAVEEFERHRLRVFGVAYRMLGSAEEAEDVVQDTFLRWHGAQRSTIGTPSAWLVKVATNLCLNRLTSARARREHYVGPWLPEPVLTADGALGPLAAVEQRDMVSLAFLVLLERLTPTERAVFVLREAFGYSHRDIAQVLELSEANSRQLYRRARRSLAASDAATGTVATADSRAAADGTADDGTADDRVATDRAAAERAGTGRHAAAEDRTRHRDLLDRFLVAARTGDLPALERLLAEDVVSWADGGGEVGAARRPIVGASRVARYLLGGLTGFGTDGRLLVAEVNGVPAVLAWRGPHLLGVLVPAAADGAITAIRIIANPAKLRFAAAQAVGLSHPAGLSGS
ncbi:RNA polymerase sigma-70 factor (ECF subfamily) [Actinoalloteichus hoggarensis]|uniref:ECF RNA polymerase sigma factor SigJ n=1 Tax=Actinoalloteichus hoggarensis TaxID=1470176 RepID=A0A221VXM0_9PSEU|nr:sigma-70 family RNA polymerase sigma factor [Actinoalloteichus hoggarensis]ASO18286.1 ECF RNA polymerase sigma factor SigJ [Actinoalloteichus hoggarensis]MBB5921648.1 RNA polymerase sigma-70 factor (ECF subfamily) [Actinoalloteichus hoggarensis]